MRWLRWLIPCLLLAIAAGVAVLALARPVPLEERVRRIRPGMTLDEAETVLESPPGNYIRYRAYTSCGSPPQPDDPMQEWQWDDGIVEVWFGPDWRVQEVRFYPNDHPASLWERIRYHLPW